MKFFNLGLRVLLSVLLSVCNANGAVSSTGASSQASDRFSAQLFHQVVNWNGKLWLVGGYAKDGDKNDVWSSQDGVNWTQKKTSAEFLARWGLEVVSFNRQLLVIDGDRGIKEQETPYQMQNDIWSSRTGILWQAVNWPLFATL